MPLSRIRANAPEKTEDLAYEAVGDSRAYVTFTQKKDGAPHVIAGSIDAPDASMAIIFAKEHYGQDQECISIWMFESSTIASTHADHPTSTEPGPERAFQIFTQKASGDLHVEAGLVEALHSEAALEKAKQHVGDPASFHCIWVVDWNNITATKEGEMIWRTTDQTYRLARGYAKDVRQKWEAVRAAKDVDVYQAEDLKEEF